MSDAVTLVHETRNPKVVQATKPTTITQLKSQGYRVVDAAAAPPTGYAALTSADLRAEIARRNDARDEESRIVPDGRKNVDLVAALEADDAAQAAAAEKAAAAAAGGAE